MKYFDKNHSQDTWNMAEEESKDLWQRRLGTRGVQFERTFLTRRERDGTIFHKSVNPRKIFYISPGGLDGACGACEKGSIPLKGPGSGLGACGPCEKGFIPMNGPKSETGPAALDEGGACEKGPSSMKCSNSDNIVPAV